MADLHVPGLSSLSITAKQSVLCPAPVSRERGLQAMPGGTLNQEILSAHYSLIAELAIAKMTLSLAIVRGQLSDHQ